MPWKYPAGSGSVGLRLGRALFTFKPPRLTWRSLTPVNCDSRAISGRRMGTVPAGPRSILGSSSSKDEALVLRSEATEGRANPAGGAGAILPEGFWLSMVTQSMVWPLGVVVVFTILREAWRTFSQSTSSGLS